MKLKQIGFFDSLPDKERLTIVQGMCDGDANPNKEQILQYLRNAHLLFASVGLTKDLLSESHEIIGAPHVMTDGQWAWTLDLAHYVEKHNCRLPDEFVEHMAANHWICPKILQTNDFTVDYYEEAI